MLFTPVRMTNHLIAGLPSTEPFQYVYFPLTGFISLMIKIDGHQPLEVGRIGETLALGVNAAPLHAVVQGAGTALRMTVRIPTIFTSPMNTWPTCLECVEVASLLQRRYCKRKSSSAITGETSAFLTGRVWRRHPASVTMP